MFEDEIDSIRRQAMRYSKGQRLRWWTQLDPKQAMHKIVQV